MNSTPEPQTARYRCAEEAAAAQWTGSNDEQLRAFCGSDFDTIDPEDRGEDPDETAAVRAHPHGGWLGLKPGDWVVKHADHFSAASDEEFRARWSPAAVSVAVPPTVERRDRYAAAVDEGFRLHAELEDVSLGDSITSSVLAVADAEQAGTRAAAPVALSDTERQFLTFALDQAADEMSFADGFTDEDRAALEKLRRMAAEEQPETQAGHEAHPPYTNWLVEVRMDEGHWAVAYPTHDHEKALDRLAKRRAQQPDRTWRLVRETDTYTVEAEQPESETHVVADDSDDPEHVDDCPGCTDFSLTGHVATAPAVVSQPDEEAHGPRTVCICGHTRGEHIAVSGRLLCDACDPDSTDNLVCKEFEAL